MELTRKQRIVVAVCAAALANSTLLVTVGCSRLLKHGSEHLFGFEARTWAFALFGLSLVGILGAAIALGTTLKARG